MLLGEFVRKKWKEWGLCFFFSWKSHSAPWCKFGMCFSWCIPEGKVYGVALFSLFFTALSPKQTELTLKWRGGGKQQTPPSWGTLIPPSSLDTTLMGILGAHRKVIALFQFKFSPPPQAISIENATGAQSPKPSDLLSLALVGW